MWGRNAVGRQTARASVELRSGDLAGEKRGQSVALYGAEDGELLKGTAGPLQGFRQGHSKMSV